MGKKQFFNSLRGATKREYIIYCFKAVQVLVEVLLNDSRKEKEKYLYN